MKKIIAQKNLFIIYGLILLGWVTGFILSRYLGFSPWILLVVFTFLMLLPGFGLARIFKIDFGNDNLGKFLLWIVLGFIYALSASLLAILLGLTLAAIIKIYLIGQILILIVSLFLDYRRPQKIEPTKFAWKMIFAGENLLSLLILAVTGVILYIISLNGSLFRGGDPSFHLTVIRKAFEGAALTASNLSFVKGQVHIAYGYPIWHILLAILARVLNADMFAVYRVITVPLSGLMILVWTWMLRQIFPTKHLAALGVLMLVVFNFYYAFTVIVLPDAFGQYVLLPMTFALALKYIFSEGSWRANYKLLIVTVLMVLLMGAIHITQYFYFLILMIMFGLVYAAFSWREKGWLEIVKKIAATVWANLLIFVPAAIFLQLTGRGIWEMLKSFVNISTLRALRYGAFKNFFILAKLVYPIVPLLLIFRRDRRILFLLTIFLAVPLLYLPGVREVLIRGLGYIFLNRLYANVNWFFVIFAFVFGFILLLLDRLISKLHLAIRLVIDLILAGFLIWLARLAWTTDQISNLYGQIFSANLGRWLNAHYLYLAAGAIIIVVLIAILAARSKKINEFFVLHEPKDYLSQVLLIMILSLFLFSPRFVAFKAAFDPLKIKDKQFSYEATANLAGGVETINFVRSQVPAKSVILANSKELYLEMLTDQQATAYPHTADERYYDQVFGKKLTIPEKLKILAKGKVDYILLVPAQNETWFDQNPQYFTKIFSASAAIYKVDKNQVKQAT